MLYRSVENLVRTYCNYRVSKKLWFIEQATGGGAEAGSVILLFYENRNWGIYAFTVILKLSLQNKQTMISRITPLGIEEYSRTISYEASEHYKKSTFGVQNDSNLCLIHEIFKNEKGQNSHSCIACNLSDISDYLLNCMSNLLTTHNQFDAFISFCLPAYLLVERFEEIFRIMKLPDYYEQRHFQDLKIIRRWANFLKHPKAFLFVHHPEFYFEDEVSIDDDSKREYTIIDTDFIEEHYKGDSKNAKLYTTLTNKDKVIVLFPSLFQLVDKLITSQNHFIDIITTNKVFREVLTEKSVLINYFEDLDQQKEKKT